MADTKELKGVQEEPMAVVVVAAPVQNDSSEGLARMYSDLELPALKLRSSATALLFLSLLMCGSPEGLFGLIAAMGVLCCAAPGSLGTAYAARCTRICAIVCAGIALGNLLLITSFSFVAPELPEAINRFCIEEAPVVEGVPLEAVPAQDGSVASPALPEKTTTEKGADMVVFVAARAARKLQEVSEADAEARCERAQRFAADYAPYVLFSVFLLEFCLFLTAMTTARRAKALVLEARRMGANGL